MLNEEFYFAAAASNASVLKVCLFLLVEMLCKRFFECKPVEASNASVLKLRHRSGMK